MNQTTGRALNVFTAAILGTYLLFIIGMMVVGRSTVTPDLFAVFALAVAAILGRARAYIRDWLPFIAILLAWQAMRGLAWEAGFPVHSGSVIAVERFLGFGHIPSEVLQSTFYVPGRLTLLDGITTSVYFLHFFATLTIGFALWLIDRRHFQLFAAALLVLSVAQFVTATVFPVAPPRFAFLFGDTLAVDDIAQRVSNAAEFHTVTWAYSHLNANPFAAFPSLHAAYPLLAFFVLRERWPRMSWAALGYTVVVLFTIVYLGHHYVVDAFGGWIYAYVAFRVARAYMSGRFQLPAVGFSNPRWATIPLPAHRIASITRAKRGERAD